MKLRKMIKDATGVKRLYFSPETNTKMTYPCIKYDHADREYSYADNKKYQRYSEYTVTYITTNPDDAIDVCNGLEEIPYSTANRTYVADGLYHFVYTINV